MGDYLCRECDDRGDCIACSPHLEPDRIHAACGVAWKDHPIDRGQWHRCPSAEPGTESTP